MSLIEEVKLCMKNYDVYLQSIQTQRNTLIQKTNEYKEMMQDIKFLSATYDDVDISSHISDLPRSQNPGDPVYKAYEAREQMTKDIYKDLKNLEYQLIDNLKRQEDAYRIYNTYACTQAVIPFHFYVTSQVISNKTTHRAIAASLRISTDRIPIIYEEEMEAIVQIMMYTNPGTRLTAEIMISALQKNETLYQSIRKNER